MTGSGRGRNEREDPPGLPGSRRLKKLASSPGSAAGSAYQGAVEAVFAIVIATGVGYWADTRFGTSPRWLIVGTLVGFGAFVLRLARMAKLVEDPRDPHEPGDEDESQPTSEHDETRTDDPERR